MIETERGYRFETTGREFYANGYIGIDSGLGIAQGYDRGIDISIPHDDEDYEPNELKKAERNELADYMISLWTKFKDSSAAL